MSSRIRLFFGCCLLAATLVSAAMATGGSARGVVMDSSGTPLAKVTVTLQGVDFAFEKVTTTNKKGKFNFTISDAGRDYVIRLEKDGYVTREQPFKLSSGQVVDSEWILNTEAEAAEQSKQLQALQAQDKATKAYNKGAEAYNAKDLEAAIGHFREAVNANPELEMAHAALSRVLLETERWGEARAAAEAFLAVAPDEPLALQILYDSYWGEGDKENADEVLKRLALLDSGTAVAARIFNQAVAAAKVDDYDAAARGFTQALEVDPGLYQALLPLAQIHYSKGEWQAAIDKAEEYLGHDAGNARANIVRYVSYQELGNKEAADEAFAELEQNSPLAAAEMFLRDAINFFNNGSIAEATEAVQTSVALDPTNPQAHHQLGLCYASARENGKARVAFEKFLELAPDHPEAASVKDMLKYLN
ncbi:MAG: tetratricopeptide repeat protein [bacterium]|nr:tetratricopeptide repeat protein [bacterium]